MRKSLGLIIPIVLLAVLVSTISGEPSSDFDGDGVVAFPDFLLFASKFGSTSGESNYEARFDLDNSGEIDFGDFVAFTAEFGLGENSAAKIGRPNIETLAKEVEDLAKEYQRQGDYEKAAMKYREFLAMTRQPLGRVRGLTSLGITYVGMDSLKAAAELLRNTLKKYNSSTDHKIKSQLSSCNAYLGYTYFLQGDIVQAIHQWDQALAFQAPIITEK